MSNTMLPPASIAALVGCSTHELLRAESAGLIPPAVRTAGGHRRWPISALSDIAAALTYKAPGTEHDAAGATR